MYYFHTQNDMQSPSTTNHQHGVMTEYANTPKNIATFEIFKYEIEKKDSGEEQISIQDYQAYENLIHTHGLIYHHDSEGSRLMAMKWSLIFTT